MAKTLEQYVAEATNAYAPASTAVQSQLDALAGQLNTTTDQINRNYELQQSQLDKSKDQAAATASMQAAGSGGSFGGAANIANRKYYQQTYVPAITTLQTNQTNDLASARQANEDQRTSLNSQLANLQAQANNQALTQYNTAVESEAQRAFQEQQAALEREYQTQQAELTRQFQAQQAALDRENQQKLAAKEAATQNAYYNYLLEAAKASQANTNTNTNTYKNWDFGNGYAIQEMPNGTANYTKNGTTITAGDFLTGTAKNANWDLWNDVWNNGVSTAGVGSDTVSAISKYLNSGLNANYLNKSSKYGYLWS